MTAFLALVQKDLLLYLGNRRALVINLLAPILIAAFFGYVMNSGGGKKISPIPVAAVNLDQSAVADAVIAGMKADTTLDLKEMSEAEALVAVKTGKLRAAFVLPKNFGSEASKAMFQPTGKPEIAIHYDPSQAMMLALVQGLLTQHVMKAVSQSIFSASGSTKYFEELRGDVAKADMGAQQKRDLLVMFESIEKVQGSKELSNAGPGAGGFDTPFKTRAAEVTSGQDRKYNSFSQSFAGMGMQFVLFMGIEFGVALLLARRLGLWKRLRAAPLSRTVLLGSRITSGAIIALIFISLIYAAGMAFFGVRVEGSVAGFVLVLIAFALLTSTFGLLIASLGGSPEATRGISIFATLVLVMLGGAWVPSFIFPEWLQTASLAVPTRWVMDGLTFMTWRGLDFSAALPPVAVLLGFSLVFGALAVWRFQWEE